MFWIQVGLIGTKVQPFLQIAFDGSPYSMSTGHTKVHILEISLELRRKFKIVNASVPEEWGGWALAEEEREKSVGIYSL